MCESKRKQGRPTRSDGEVGKETIIRLVRELLRNEPQIELSRKTIAQKIGVSPALITYYFPQKTFFFADVSEPVLSEYLLRLKNILDADEKKGANLRPVIELLVELYGKDRKFVEIYKSMHSRQDGCVILVSMHELLADFLTNRSGGKRPQSFEAAVLQGAIEGMCDFAARATSAQLRTDQSSNSIKTGWIDMLQAHFSQAPAASAAV